MSKTSVSDSYVFKRFTTVAEISGMVSYAQARSLFFSLRRYALRNARQFERVNADRGEAYAASAACAHEDELLCNLRERLIERCAKCGIVMDCGCGLWPVFTYNGEHISIFMDGE